jgi:cytochrome c oxidase subunit 2
MKSPWLLSPLIVLTLTVSRGTVAQPSNAPAPPAESVQVITVTAKKYEFDPSPIRVKAGTRVQLKITATDHAHGFSIKDSPDGANDSSKTGLIFSSSQGCLKIEEGQTATVEFVAQTPGTYSFRCCVHCGWHHRSMKGQLIVEP